MKTKEDFFRIFQVPPAMYPHIHLVVDDIEMELIVGMNDEGMTVDEVAEMMDVSREEAEEILSNAYKRAVVTREKEGGIIKYSAGTFYRRLDTFAMYENWGRVPSDVRDDVIEWQLHEFIDLWMPVVEEIRKDPDAYHKIPNRDVLLLEEVLEQVDVAIDHVVVPCDCRSIVMACNRQLDVCIRLDEGARLTLDQGHGKRITKEQCKAIVINADRAGLMHTGRKFWQGHNLFGFCNCCTCDCYPFRASMETGMQKQWPRSHHIADRSLNKCTQCGLCTMRCYFGAFYHDGSEVIINGKKRKKVIYDPEKCWGCGLCSTSCPTEAIKMRPLDQIEKSGIA